MKGTKIKFAFFTVPEWEKEEKWLCKQHKNGWKLVNATLPGIYKFEACTPEDVVYQLDYNQDGLKHKEEYMQMFRDCGWEYITDMAGYSYFRKPESEMEEKEEIFCDDDSRMDMIERVFKGRMIPLLAIFFLLIIPQLLNHIYQGTIADNIIFGIFLLMFILYVIVFVQFGTYYVKLKKNLGR